MQADLLVFANLAEICNADSKIRKGSIDHDERELIPVEVLDDIESLVRYSFCRAEKDYEMSSCDKYDKC